VRVYSTERNGILACNSVNYLESVDVVFMVKDALFYICPLHGKLRFQSRLLNVR
jgi:hypothetical protein